MASLAPKRVLRNSGADCYDAKSSVHCCDGEISGGNERKKAAFNCHVGTQQEIPNDKTRV
jgi:hypothetical protein